MLSTPQLIGAAGLVALTAGTTLAQDAPCDPVQHVVTENLDSTTITVGGSVSCTIGSGTPGHVYGRSHDLSLLGLTGDVSIGCVHWGIESTDVPIDAIVSVFLDTDGNAAPGSSAGDLTLVGSMTVPDNNTVPHFLTASFNPALTVAADHLIFVTIETPDSSGLPTIGANSAGELSPSYLRTVNGDCGIANWATTSGIGFPGTHWVEAIEIGDAVAADPCDQPLPDCPNDIDGDGATTVDDILSIIGSFGQVGDGQFRPAGDVYPLPLGNCACDVDDLLSVISSFGATCESPTGGCCNGGNCEVISE